MKAMIHRLSRFSLQRMIGATLIVGVVALLVVAVSSAKLAEAQVGNPKQRFVDQMASAQAHAAALAGKPAPTTGVRPSVPPIDVSAQYPDRFVEAPNYPCPSSFCEIRNMLQTVRAGYVLDIYGGSDRPDTAQGFIIVRTLDPNRKGAPPSATYRTPDRQGAIHLDSVSGDVVSFTTADGHHGTFDFVSRTFGG